MFIKIKTIFLFIHNKITQKKEHFIGLPAEIKLMPSFKV